MRIDLVTYDDNGQPIAVTELATQAARAGDILVVCPADTVLSQDEKALVRAMFEAAGLSQVIVVPVPIRVFRVEPAE